MYNYSVLLIPSFNNFSKKRQISQKEHKKSTESPGDIIFGTLIGRRRKNLFGIAVLDEITEQKECGFVGDTSCLLHVVRYDYYSRRLFEFVAQFFYFAGRNGIESGSRFVHKNYLRLNRKRAGNAQSLLLAAG